MNKKIENKYILLIVLLIGIVMVLFPILINTLMFIKVSPVAGEEGTWISSLSTFWGAIIGGIISGVLTLYGVRLTLFKQEKKEIIRAYPERRKLGDDILAVVSEAYRVSKKSLETNELFDFKNYLKNLMLKSDELLSKSSKVNDEVYEVIRTKFLVAIREFEYSVGGTLPNQEERYRYYISLLHEQTIVLSVAIDNITEEYNKAKKN